jgi:hypothetical protein
MNAIPTHVSEVKVKGLVPFRLYKLQGVLNRNNVAGFCVMDAAVGHSAYYTTYAFTGYNIDAYYVGPIIPPNCIMVHIVDNVYCMCTIPASVRSVVPSKKKASGIVVACRKFWKWFDKVVA